MAFDPIQKFIPRAANSLGIGRQVEAAYICEIFRKAAPEIIHPQANKYVTPKSFRNGTLFISVQNSTWANEVISHEPELLAAFGKIFSKNPVRKIKTMVG